MPELRQDHEFGILGGLADEVEGTRNPLVYRFGGGAVQLDQCDIDGHRRTVITGGSPAQRLWDYGDQMLEAPLDFDGLVNAWRTSVLDIQGVTMRLEPMQWRLETPCPGWSIADVVSHVIDAESMIAGDPRPAHEPDWQTLPHVTSDFARMTEVGVDARRGRSPEDLLAELNQSIARREDQLASGPRNLDAEVPAFTAAALPLGRLLTMRTFDTWVHSQDIRDAIGQPGGLGSAGAQVSASLMLQALPRIWAKVVGAPIGSVLHVEVLGPEILTSAMVEVMPDGRAVLTQNEPGTGQPVGVHLQASWPTFMHVMAGRPQTPNATEFEVAGDPSLVDRLVPALNIAP